MENSKDFHLNDQKSDSMVYESPKLKKYGKVSEITLGGGSDTQDDGTFGMNIFPTNPV